MWISVYYNDNNKNKYIYSWIICQDNIFKIYYLIILFI